MAGAFENATFVREAEDLLEQIEGATLELERVPSDAESINLLFRAFHTIKGSSAMVGLDAIASFTHHVESALDRVRAGALAVTPGLISAVLAAKDEIARLLQCAVRGQTPDLTPSVQLIATLDKLQGDKLAVALQTKAPRLRTTYQLDFRLKLDEQSLGIDAADLISELTTLGTAHVSQTAAADQDFGAAWQVLLTTEASEDALRDVFIFAPSGSELRIIAGLSEFVTEPPPARTTRAPAAGNLQVVSGAASGAQLAANAESPKSKAQARSQDTVRVSSDRLDQLMKLVGELVINQSRLQQAHAQIGAADLVGPVESMERLISELRDSVFSIRMMPIGPTFARFKRLARDLSEQLGKEIALITEGNETELDKTVLDQLGDPLVHLLRNSMDHGIELPAERLAKGKPARGTVLLTAAHDGGQVVITIKDDGAGLDRERIRKKAEEKGLVDPRTHLSDQETLELIMRPGFSTAAAVTQLSGRGVGMDVVKRTVEGLRGSLSIASVQGTGTTIRLSMPLTLAIIDGLVVEVRGDHFIVPMAAVTENLELTKKERAANNGRNAVAVRGELVPYLRLRELFELEDTGQEIEKIVVVTLEGQRIGLVVDKVVGSHQTVIQPLGPLYREVGLFSGTTIMGDGRVVMILDLAGTLRQAERRLSLRDQNRARSAERAARGIA